MLVILAAFVLFKYAALSPWALHIGGRSTLDEQWDGFGQVQASNGGRYLLFVHLLGGAIHREDHSRRSGGGLGMSDNLHGSATLCTQSGQDHTFKLTGVVHAWRTTDDAHTTIKLTDGTPVRLPSGWVIAFHGAWRGPALELASPDNSFTEVLTPRGEIRHKTSTADAGDARVTLQYGSRSDFEAACRAIRNG